MIVLVYELSPSLLSVIWKPESTVIVIVCVPALSEPME